jgi:predicted ABC-class ATPase
MMTNGKRNRMERYDLLPGKMRDLDGRGYKAYKDTTGCYHHDDFVFCIDHVQSDPFAPPSRCHLELPSGTTGLPEWAYRNRSRRRAAADYLVRRFRSACREVSSRHRGKGGGGKGGDVDTAHVGQEVLLRSTATVGGPDSKDAGSLELRFTVGLPAFGRRIAGKQAAGIFGTELPEIVAESLVAASIDWEELQRHVETVEDAQALRRLLHEHDLVGFVADGAVLPRRSGVDDRPMQGRSVVAFESPESMRREMELPNRGTISGMAIPRGVTLVAGGGYHGKSTLLRALERGVYDHIPGDGRELVVTEADAVKVRSEDGRRVEGVTITPFINNLPGDIDTEQFRSDDASGSTSQAANIMEALEVGASALLVDEDTSATNFMIRDHRMQELVAGEEEPITPFIDKVRLLSDELGVSSILVIGGSGDYFDVADTVIVMREYRPYEMTAEARAIAGRLQTQRRGEGGTRFGDWCERCPRERSLDPSKGKRDVKVRAHGTREIQFGGDSIHLAAVEQIVDAGQTRAIAHALVVMKSIFDRKLTLRQALDEIARRVEEEGLDALTPHPMGDLAAFRRFELAAALNRLRTLRVDRA